MHSLTLKICRRSLSILLCATWMRQANRKEPPHFRLGKSSAETFVVPDVVAVWSEVATQFNLTRTARQSVVEYQEQRKMRRLPEECAGNSHVTEALASGTSSLT